MWEEITNPFPNSKGCNIEIWEWINNFFPHFTGLVITYPCWDWSWSMSVKGGLGLYGLNSLASGNGLVLSLKTYLELPSRIWDSPLLYMAFPSRKPLPGPNRTCIFGIKNFKGSLGHKELNHLTTFPWRGLSYLVMCYWLLNYLFKHILSNTKMCFSKCRSVKNV